VDQADDIRVKLNERPEGIEAVDFSFNRRAGFIFLGDFVPRVGFQRL